MEIVDVPLNNNLTCSVCNQLFNNPKSLSCGHFYCKGCLEQTVVQSMITCPRCRQKTEVPAGGVTKLDTNAFINQAVLVHSGAVTNPKCDGFNQVSNECDPATSICFDCKIFLCDYCRYFHQRDRTNSHIILSLNDTPKAHMSTVPLCTEHGYELKRYCGTCNELVCAYCTRGKHKTHDYDTVAAMASKHRNELKQLTAPVEGMVHNVSETHNKIDNMKERIRRQGNEVKQEIDQHYETLFQNLMMQKEKLKQQVDNIVLQKEQALSVQKSEVDPLHQDLLQMKRRRETLDGISDQEVLSEMQNITDSMQWLNINCQNLNKHPVQSATLEYIPTKDPLPHFGQLFVFGSPRTSEITNLSRNSVFVGERVQATIITKDCNGVPCSKGGCKISAELKSVNGYVTFGEVQDKSDGSYMVSVAGKEIGKAKLSVFINGYELKGSPCTVTVIRNYQAMKLPSTILNNNGTMGELWGAASSKNGIWGVADNSNHCIYVFDTRDRLIRRFGSHGKDKGQLNSPHGITFDNDNNLYVADSSNHRVQKFDISGNYLMQFKGHIPGESQLQYPYGVAVHNDWVYVVDRDSHRIMVFQVTSGRFSFSFGADKLSRPYDVEVNVNNQLYVIDNDQHCVKMFTLDGHYVGKFGTQGSGKGQLNEPYCLGTDLNGFVLVSDRNHRVSVYDCAGCFVHCFGACGSGNSQFKYPRGIAVSQTGSIHVCDEDNHRVQIFSS